MVVLDIAAASTAQWLYHSRRLSTGDRIFSKIGCDRIKGNVKMIEKDITFEDEGKLWKAADKD
ncbi:MAG: hypothetical protein ACXQTM_00015 [Methanosarcinales archaeon]